jgi:hypothetical protein
MSHGKLIRPLAKRKFDTGEMVAKYPPRWQHPNKEAVYRIVCAPGCKHGGHLTYSRWPAFPLPEVMDVSGQATELVVSEDVFTYDPPPQDPPGVEWHLNFAASDLFCAYGSALLAQDEMQVAEHPALGSLREALLTIGESTLTVEDGVPTPILVTGVERRCRIATEPNAAEGRPNGLYGNNFARAPVEVASRAIAPLNPPTISNIIAIEAPSYGQGLYRRDEIEFILRTAYTGFSAARLESCAGGDLTPRVIIHTGFWGCGAYGGNRVLMALLQVAAARLTRVDRLVFHTLNRSGSDLLRCATAMIDDEIVRSNRHANLETLLVRIEAKGFRWGASDGN